MRFPFLKGFTYAKQRRFTSYFFLAVPVWYRHDGQGGISLCGLSAVGGTALLADPARRTDGLRRFALPVGLLVRGQSLFYRPRHAGEGGIPHPRGACKGGHGDGCGACGLRKAACRAVSAVAPRL